MERFTNTRYPWVNLYHLNDMHMLAYLCCVLSTVPFFRLSALGLQLVRVRVIRRIYNFVVGMCAVEGGWGWVGGWAGGRGRGHSDGFTFWSNMYR